MRKKEGAQQRGGGLSMSPSRAPRVPVVFARKPRSPLEFLRALYFVALTGAYRFFEDGMPSKTRFSSC